MNLQLYASLALISALGSGCATLTKGTSQTVTVNTDPAGATCTLSRDGKPVAVVNPTPGSIPVEKASGSISVLCKKATYQDAAGVLASEFQGMTFGNILFGGLIGVAVDAASGAMNKYPEMVTITMIPEEFPSAAARDKFFEDMKLTLLREAAEVKDRISKSCKPDNCASELAAADAGTQSKVADIEQRRLLARVRAGVPAVATIESTPVAIPVSLTTPVQATPTAASAPPPVQATPTAAASAPPSASRSKYLFSAERFAKDTGCLSAVASINIRTPAYETFTVTCSNGDPRSIRCDDGAPCRELK